MIKRKELFNTYIEFKDIFLILFCIVSLINCDFFVISLRLKDFGSFYSGLVFN